MAQQLRHLAALAEDLIWFLAVLPGSSQPPVILASGDLMLSFELLRISTQVACMYT